MHERRELWVVAAWSLFASALLLLPAETLLEQSILIDDTFYALSAARHLASGEGSTVDGVHPTNGYQPLWVWVVSLLTAVGGLTPDGTVRLALVLCAALTLLCALRLGGLVRLLGGTDRASWAAVLLWLANPYLLRRQLNGLESVLAAWLVIETVRACLLGERGYEEPAGGQGAPRRFGSRVSRELRSGAAAGLAALARIDLAVLAPLLALRRRWVAAAAALLVPLPWIAWCWLRFGHPVPLSGAANRTLFAIVHDLPDPALLLWESSNASWTVASLFALAWPAEALRRAGLPGGLSWIVVPAALALLSATVLPGGGARERIAVWWRAGRPLVHWIAGLALYDAVAYGLIYPAPWHLNRYFLPLHALGIAWVALFYDKVVVQTTAGAAPEPKRSALRRCLVWWGLWGAAVAAATVPYWADTTGGQPPSLQLGVARWLREEAPPDWKVGMVQSGIVGYYAERLVINLDGKVNPSAHEALRRRRMGEYLDEEEITLFGDWNDLVERCVFARADPGLRERVRSLDSGEGAPGPPFVFYRRLDE